MRIKRFRGNITFLALFVLLASALIGVLVTLFMKNFLRYSDDITTYERTSYLAKAGTELWLAIINSRNPGLEYTLQSGNDLIKNFSCPYGKKEGEPCTHQPAFSLSISGLANSIENCSAENPIKVWPWLSVILPLFKDSGINSANEGLNKGKIEAHEKEIEVKSAQERVFSINAMLWKLQNQFLDDPEKNLSYTSYLSGWKGERKQDYFEKITNTIEQDFNYKSITEKYLIITNPNSTEQSLCINNSNGIPQESVKIVSIGFFKNKQLWTETLAKKALPDFLRSDNYLWGWSNPKKLSNNN